MSVSDRGKHKLEEPNSMAERQGPKDHLRGTSREPSVTFSLVQICTLKIEFIDDRCLFLAERTRCLR